MSDLCKSGIEEADTSAYISVGFCPLSESYAEIDVGHFTVKLPNFHSPSSSSSSIGSTITVAAANLVIGNSCDDGYGTAADKSSLPLLKLTVHDLINLGAFQTNISEYAI